jgi:hypothetical protein
MISGKWEKWEVGKVGSAGAHATNKELFFTEILITFN